MYVLSKDLGNDESMFQKRQIQTTTTRSYFGEFSNLFRSLDFEKSRIRTQFPLQARRKEKWKHLETEELQFSRKKQENREMDSIDRIIKRQLARKS